MTLDPAAEADATAARVEDATAALERLERQFGLLFDGYRQRLRARATDLNPKLQPSGYKTLVTLIRQGESGASQLAETLGFDKSVLSRQLHQLEELGLVTREQDPRDRRAVILRPTPSAVAKVEGLAQTDRDDFRAQMLDWEPGELDELVRLLAKLRSHPASTPQGADSATGVGSE